MSISNILVQFLQSLIIALIIKIIFEHVKNQDSIAKAATESHRKNHLEFYAKIKISL